MNLIYNRMNSILETWFFIGAGTHAIFYSHLPMYWKKKISFGGDIFNIEFGKFLRPF